MSTVFRLQQGSSPLLVSIPHSGTAIPPDIEGRFTEQALRLGDTDWFIPELYDFVFGKDITIVQANYNRLVIDLNRPPDDESLYPGMTTTGLCPKRLFDGHDVYRDGYSPDENEIASRIEAYWQPYHRQLQQEIQRLRGKHGFCMLYDAHSIRSEVPGLFEGTLPDLNLGTNYGKSCSSDLQALVTAHLSNNGAFSWIINGRFIGGYITRHYGNKENAVHAVQMEIAQNSYMNELSRPQFEAARAEQLGGFLQDLFDELQMWKP